VSGKQRQIRPLCQMAPDDFIAGDQPVRMAASQ
jgi:hypothetical protein